MTRSLRTALVAVAGVVLSVACASGGPAQVTASVELQGDAPFTVDATDPGEIAGDDVEHQIVFTIVGDRAVIIDDVRWTSGELTDGGAFATAGHGCSPQIEPTDGDPRVVHACTEEFRFLEVRPDAPLRETVTVSGSLDGRPIAEGTFTLEQPLRWWFTEATADPGEALSADPDGEATVQVTYEVMRSA